MRILVIGNPIAGGGRARRLIGTLRDILRRRGHETEVYLTTAAGDARSRAAALEPGCEAVIACGGDGTLNEVLNGLPDPSAVPLGFLPAGTANVTARELGLGRRPETLADIIDAGRTRRIDMGIANGRRFLMVASTGFDAMVVEEIARRRKGPLGFARYVRPILAVMRRYRPPRIEVRVDGGTPIEGALAIVSNSPHYAGILTVSDRARCDSGALDVCVFLRASIPDICRLGAAALAGRLGRARGVVHLRGSSIDIASTAPTPIEVDGDWCGSTPLLIEAVPGAVTVLAPDAVHAPRRRRSP